MEKVEGKKRRRDKQQSKGEDYIVNDMQKIETKKRGDKKKSKGDFITESSVDAKTGNDSTKSKIWDSEEKSERMVDRFVENHEEENDNKGKTKKDKLVGNGSNDPQPRKSSKKVRFSGRVEVFPASDDSNSGEGDNKGEKLVQGKWFTQAENEIVKKAVYRYIEVHDLGEEGLYVIFNGRKYPELKNCWKEMGNAIQYRPHSASKLFQSAEEPRWTQEEYEMVLKSQKEYGNQWKALADELGKHKTHVRNAWLRKKLPNLKKGRWSQEEYQGLFDLVNADLQQRFYEEERSRHGMLRDNICWTAISDKLATRTQPKCCIKWYSQLTSTMVAEGIWADADDYPLNGALFSLNASSVEDVNWANLLDHRSGDVLEPNGSSHRSSWKQVIC
ncbi:cyclin-D-binding Myb-like transcription factor 1 [Olea europaea var. sylvestris]|uniref:cyclin-D-binding Myb-like transcription factor 1 n=1 Tax=Olea europaea var. sylvestris TaxID=158386 RepID=UPI000C1D6257|nr:cyclin-D-binding Myb-like transcription factor 1 [Olea europaea var. sylvestris]